MNDFIHVKDDKTTRVMELKGILDESLSRQLEALLSQTDLSENQKIVIDLKNVTVMQPEGVRVLINASLNQNEAGLGLKNPNAGVKQLLITVGLDGLIQ